MVKLDTLVLGRSFYLSISTLNVFIQYLTIIVHWSLQQHFFAIYNRLLDLFDFVRNFPRTVQTDLR